MASGYDLDGGAAPAVALQTDYTRRSEAVAAAPHARLDLAYGRHERQRFDLFGAGPQAPSIVFFHGGYWKAGSKESRRFPAGPWNTLGVSWIAVNYRLTPDHDLSACVADARAAVAFLSSNAAALGLDPASLHLAGNSAGGHLAAMVAANGWAGRPAGIRSLCAVSGLFDLRPLLHAPANAWLRLTATDAGDLSPQNHLPPSDLPVLIGCGGAETAEFRGQSQTYAARCRRAGNPVERFESPDADHFRIIGEFGQPETPLFSRLRRLIDR